MRRYKVSFSADQIRTGADEELVKDFIEHVSVATNRSEIALFRRALPVNGKVVYYVSPGAMMHDVPTDGRYRTKPCGAPRLSTPLMLMAGDEESAWDLLPR